MLNKNIIANFLGRGSAALINLACIPIYVRYLGIEAFGMVGFYNLLIAWAAFFDFGLGGALTRQMALLSVDKTKDQEMRDLLRTLEINFWILGALVTFGIACYEKTYAYMGAAVALQLISSLYLAGFIGLQKQIQLNVLTTCSMLFRVGITIFVLWHIEASIQAFFVCQMIASLVHTGIAAVILWGFLPITNRASRFNKELLKKVKGYAFGMFMLSILGLLLTQLDKWILGNMLTLEMFGYYSLAWMVAGGLYYISGPVVTAYFPRFAQLSALDEEEAVSEFHKAAKILSCLLLPVACVIILFSKEIMQIWIGDETVVKHTHLLVSLLTIGSVLNGLISLPYVLQLALGQVRLAVIINVVAVLFLMPAVAVAVHYFQSVGAACIWIALNLGYALIGSKWLVLEKRKWFLEDIGILLLGALFVPLCARLFLQSCSFFYLALILILSFISCMVICQKLLRSSQPIGGLSS